MHRMTAPFEAAPIAARPCPSMRLAAGAVALLATLSWPVGTYAGQSGAPLAANPAPTATQAASASGAAARPLARAASNPKAVQASTRPQWSELTATQQQALAPLATGWPTLSEAQKRKWLAMSGNFDRLAPEERAKLHSRMADWVALSPQQRTQARLNFGETKSLGADDKKAKWEAYQALSAEEKKRLAAGAQTRTPPTAAAVRPVPPQRLATVPKGTREDKPARIASAPPPGQTPPAAPAPVNPLHTN
jgi:hypothetical protein